MKNDVTSPIVMVSPTVLPQAAIDFAREFAGLCSKHNLKKADVTLNLNWNDVRGNTLPVGQRFDGAIEVHFWSRDGRGRPCDNVRLTFESTLSVDVVKTRESSD